MLTGTGKHGMRMTYIDTGRTTQKAPSPMSMTAGKVEWEGPSARAHWAVNVGTQPCEQVTVFRFDHPDAARRNPLMNSTRTRALIALITAHTKPEWDGRQSPHFHSATS